MTTITSASAERRAKRETSRAVDSSQDAPSRLALWPPSSSAVLAAATLVGIFALGWFSVVTRPALAAGAVWWPASGLAIGLGIRTPRRLLWWSALAVGVVLLGANVAQDGSLPMAVASSVGAALEMAIGTMILRSGGRETPRLANRGDLARLLMAIVLAVTAYDVTTAVATLALGDPMAALLQVFSAGPRRAAGMMLVAPLFLRVPALDRNPGRAFSISQLCVALLSAVLVFGVNDFPLAFLVIVPPVVGALSIGARWLTIELLLVSVIASYASANGHGPFSFARVGPVAGGMLLQAFELTMAIIVLLISLTVTGERRAAARAQRQDAEELASAGVVQRALTPAELPSRPGWEHGAAAVAARHVGGDFYDLRIAGRFAVMTLGDVMGKGAGAGLLAAATRTALRASHPERRPSDALGDGVRIIEDDLNRSNAFVTLGYAVINLLTGDVTLADAGHGLSFVVGKDGRDVGRLASTDLPLGLGTEWSEVRTRLEPGESLLMVSDGVLDRWGGSIEELMEAIRVLRSDPAIESPQQLAEVLCKGGDPDAEPEDDATAVMFHRESTATSASRALPDSMDYPL